MSALSSGGTSPKFSADVSDTQLFAREFEMQPHEADKPADGNHNDIVYLTGGRYWMVASAFV